MNFGSFNKPARFYDVEGERSGGGRGIPLDFGLSNKKAEENGLR